MSLPTLRSRAVFRSPIIIPPPPIWRIPDARLGIQYPPDQQGNDDEGNNEVHIDAGNHDAGIQVDIVDHIQSAANPYQQGYNDGVAAAANVVPPHGNKAAIWRGVALLSLTLLSAFSMEEMLDILRPHVIRYARSAAVLVWERWGAVIASTAAHTYAPRLTPVLISFICRLPPHLVTLLRPDYIALLPPSYIETLPPYYIETLPRYCIESLSPSCIESLSPSCIESLSASTLMRLSPLCRENLALDLGTQAQMQLIHIHHIVDRFSTMLIAPVLPWIPVPIVTYATRFSVVLGFWSLTFSLWRLVSGGVFFGEIPAAGEAFFDLVDD